jgi:cyanophycinase
VDLAAGNILVVPLASEIPADVAASVVHQLKGLGATDVSVFACVDASVDDFQCLEQIRAARLIFFTGGSQLKLARAFRGSAALNLIRHRVEEGLHLSGTSAGTAIMSEVMLTGSPLPPFERIAGVRPLMVETREGFGFVRRLILDQHFLKRDRVDRLTSAVYDRQHLVGVGIDEATAILVDADESFEVLGESAVMVIDARNAVLEVDATGNYRSIGTEGTIFRLLRAGERFRP